MRLPAHGQTRQIGAPLDFACFESFALVAHIGRRGLEPRTNGFKSVIRLIESHLTVEKRGFRLQLSKQNRSRQVGLTTPGESYATENAPLETHRPRIGSSHVL